MAPLQLPCVLNRVSLGGTTDSSGDYNRKGGRKLRSFEILLEGNPAKWRQETWPWVKNRAL
jgi:hypothetical protein